MRETFSNHYLTQSTPKNKFASGSLLVYIYTTTQVLWEDKAFPLLSQMMNGLNVK